MAALYCIFLYLILCALSTGLASATHGGNYLGKVYVIAFHMFAAPLVAPIFWILFRGHKQAKAGLDLTDGGNDYDAVVKAYYIKPIGLLMARILRWCKENPLNEIGARRQQEICGDAVIGGILGILSILIGGAIYAAS